MKLGVRCSAGVDEGRCPEVRSGGRRAKGGKLRCIFWLFGVLVLQDLGLQPSVDGSIQPSNPQVRGSPRGGQKGKGREEEGDQAGEPHFPHKTVPSR